MAKTLHEIEAGQMQGWDQPVSPRATLLPQKGLGTPAPTRFQALPLYPPVPSAPLSSWFRGPSEVG